MIDTPLVTQSVALRTACMHLTVKRELIREVMGPGISEIFGALAAQGVAPIGAWFTHHRRRPNATFDFAICVPVAKPIVPSGRVVNGELPAARVARTVHLGPYEELGAAWGEFHAWIAAQGHTSRTDLWECYLRGPESGPDAASWRTELNQPLT